MASKLFKSELLKRTLSAAAIIIVVAFSFLSGWFLSQLLIIFFTVMMLHEWITMNVRFYAKLKVTTKLLSKPSESELLLGDTEHRSGVYSDVHEHSSTGSTQQETDCGGFGARLTGPSGEVCSCRNAMLVLISGMVYVLLPMLFWIYTARASYNNFIHDIVWCIAVVGACDISAYFCGKLIGGPKFAPKISKGKTWSGTIAGFTTGFGAAYIFIPSNISTNILLCSGLMAVASILGDLLESKAKRFLKVKDSGNIIPGHGGVCDRLDSFLLVSYIVMALRLCRF
ncbi:MAG: phosphatidate cytidylyltransferase [Holosporales bacterium]|jgi:CDP-diglyceride synthetase|nr:phosphatidate cytidylyltransferase [Holosporales bacterium]